MVPAPAVMASPGRPIRSSSQMPATPMTRAAPAMASGTKVSPPGPWCSAPIKASSGVVNQTKCWWCQKCSEVRKATGVPTMSQL